MASSLWGRVSRCTAGPPLAGGGAIRRCYMFCGGVITAGSRITEIYSRRRERSNVRVVANKKSGRSRCTYCTAPERPQCRWMMASLPSYRSRDGRKSSYRSGNSFCSASVWDAPSLSTAFSARTSARAGLARAGGDDSVRVDTAASASSSPAHVFA